MTIIQICLTIYGFVADTICVAEELSAVISKNRKCSSEDLFQQCFHISVRRHRLQLSHLAEDHEPEGVAVDKEFLAKTLHRMSKELTSTGLGDAAGEKIAAYLAPCIIVPGHRLSDLDFAHAVEPVVMASFDEFLGHLPLTDVAFKEIELGHMAQTTSANTQQHSEHAAQLHGLEDLKQLMQNLLECQRQITETSNYLDPTVLQQESSRPEYRNPFRIVKAEDFDHDYAKLAVLFRAPSTYDDIRGSDNLIISGGRGCGKSMILRSLSLQTAVEIERLRRHGGNPQAPKLTFRESGLSYLGVYIKLARGYFYEWSPDCKLSDDAAKSLFQHVFNMLLLRSLAESLQEARDKGLITLTTNDERAAVKRIRKIGGFVFPNDDLPSLVDALLEQENLVADYLGQLRLRNAAATYVGKTTGIHNFMDQCCRAFIDIVPDLNSKRIYLLLDEYENLAAFQQTIVNTLAKLRPFSITVKIATRSLGMRSLVDLQGEPIQSPRDYHAIPLDYDINNPAYIQMLGDIARKRLASEQCKETNIQALLQPSPMYDPCNPEQIKKAAEALLAMQNKSRAGLQDKDWREFLHKWDRALVYRIATAERRQRPYTFAGFDAFVDLSSGIVSSFLELCKIAFYRAEGSGINVRQGEPIPFSIQNDAVYDVSKASLDWIPRNIQNTGPTISRFVLDIADITREKLLKHTSEPEAARIVLKDAANLDTDACRLLAEILYDSVKWSVLHAVSQGTAYVPKHKTEVKTTEYYLNRILCPILRLSPRPRWRTTFTTDQLAKLLDEATRRKTRNLLIQKHSQDGGGLLLPTDD